MSVLDKQNEARTAIESQKAAYSEKLSGSQMGEPQEPVEGIAIPQGALPGNDVQPVVGIGTPAAQNVENSLQDPQLQKMIEGVVASLKMANVPDADITQAVSRAGNDLSKLKVLAADAALLNSTDPADAPKQAEIRSSLGAKSDNRSGIIIISDQKGTNGSDVNTQGEERAQENATDNTPAVVAGAASLNDPAAKGLQPNNPAYKAQLTGIIPDAPAPTGGANLIKDAAETVAQQVIGSGTAAKAAAQAKGERFVI